MSKRLFIAAFFVLPFLFFFFLLFGRETIGNDYSTCFLQVTLTYRHYLQSGFFPQWYPHSDGGYPMGGLALAQFFHFPAWLISVLPGYWSGNAVEYNLVRHLLLFGLAHFLYAFLLKRVGGFSEKISFLGGALLTYTTRSLDLFRYGLFWDTYVYYLALLVFGLTYLCGGNPVFLPLVSLAMLLFITASYSPLFLFGILGALLCFLIFFSEFRLTLDQWKTRVAYLISFVGLGFFFAAPNWLIILDYLQASKIRTGNADMGWAIGESLENSHLLADFLTPWNQDTHLAMSGNSALGALLISVFIVALLRFRLWIPASLFLLYSYSRGMEGTVFVLFFDAVPGFNSLRGPFKILALTYPVLAVALCALNRNSMRSKPDWRQLDQVWSLILAVLGLVLTGALIRFDSLARILPPSRYSPHFIHEGWTSQLQMTWLICGILACFALPIWIGRIPPFSFIRNRRAKKTAATVAILALTFQIALSLKFGTWTDSIKVASEIPSQIQTANELPLYGEFPLIVWNGYDSNQRASTDRYRRVMESAPESARCYLPFFKHRKMPRPEYDAAVLAPAPILLPYYLTSRAHCVASEDIARQEMAKSKCTDTHADAIITATSYPSTPCPSEERSIPTHDEASLNARNQVKYLDSNGVILEVDTPKTTVLVTPYIWTSDRWQLSLDREAASVIEVNGGFVGAIIPSGKHQITLQYQNPYLKFGPLFFGVASLILLFYVFFRLKLPEAIHRYRLLLFLACSLISTLISVCLAHSYSAHAGVGLKQNYGKLLDQQLKKWSLRDSRH